MVTGVLVSCVEGLRQSKYWRWISSMASKGFNQRYRNDWVKMPDKILKLRGIALALVLLFCAKFGLAGPSDAPGGLPSSRVKFCSESLKRIRAANIKLFDHGFWKSRLKQVPLGSQSGGGFTSAMAEAFAMTSVANPKLGVMKQFSWRTGERIIKPNLEDLGPAANAHSRTHGITVPEYRGAMMFEGDGVRSVLSVGVIDATKDLPKTAYVARKGTLDLVIGDQKSAISKGNFEKWANDLIDKVELAKISERTNESTFYVMKPYFETRSELMPDGSTRHSLLVRNVNLPNNKFVWLIENMQKALMGNESSGVGPSGIQRLDRIFDDLAKQPSSVQKASPTPKSDWTRFSSKKPPKRWEQSSKGSRKGKRNSNTEWYEEFQ